MNFLALLDFQWRQHLRRVLKAYASCYNAVRTHLSLAKNTPAFRRAQPVDNIAAMPVPGGYTINTSGFEFSVSPTESTAFAEERTRVVRASSEDANRVHDAVRHGNIILPLEVNRRAECYSNRSRMNPR